VITTGTVAVSGVALAASVGAVGQEPATGETRIATAPLADAVAAQALAQTGSGGQVRAVALTLRTPVSLAAAEPDVTANADEPAEVRFRLTTRAGGAVADQDIVLQVLFPAGWTTFKVLRTDAQGYAAYTARVLTTTQVRAVFAGSTDLDPVTADPAIVRVRPAPVPAASPSRGAVGADAPTGATTIGAKAVYLASLQAGKPYVYGDEGPYSFDCSGLVQYVYKQLGKSLPRTTDQQFAATTRIARGAEQPGDLIFFGEPGSIYHEGIYAGDGKMWVAPKSGDVVKLETVWTSSYSVGRVP
jgi:cell wall-associated NlpC family hydrolase